MSSLPSNETTYASIVGRILEQLRSRLGASQLAFATELDLSQGAWSRIENGSTVMSVEQLKAASEFLGVTPGYIIQLADNAEAQLRVQGVDIVPPNVARLNTSLITGAALGALLAIALLKKG